MRGRVRGYADKMHRQDTDCIGMACFSLVDQFGRFVQNWPPSKDEVRQSRVREGTFEGVNPVSGITRLQEKWKELYWFPGSPHI